MQIEETNPMLSMRKVSIALTVTVACLALLVPSMARAACMGDWDLNGEMQFLQGNTYGWFTLQQRGSELTGTATYAGGESGGKIEGTINGNKVSITVYWNSGSAGVYEGTVSPQGWIVGETHDLMHPGSRAQWRSQGQVGCKVVETTTSPSQPTTHSTAMDRHICIKTGGSWDIANGKCIRHQASDQPLPPPAAPAPEAQAPTCTAQLDVEVFDKPDGVGTKIGELAGSHGKTLVRAYALAEPCRDNWCHLRGSGVPAGDGWVYSGPDYQSPKCS